MLCGVVSELVVEPSPEQFAELSKRGNVVPVSAQLAADFETPLSAYVKIRDDKHAFLLESAESTDASGRWSILGSGPRAVFTARGDQLEIIDRGRRETVTVEGDVLAELERRMAHYQPVVHGDPPPFWGGLVGYLAYDAVRQFEPTIGPSPPDDLGVPDAVFMLADTLLMFDHRLRRLLVVANA